MALNLNLLRSFWQVAQAGSVSGAAQSGFVSQPALSKAVKELEQQVGLPLLERRARGVTLTEAGNTLFEYASAIFALEREAQDALRAQKSLVGTTLRIGASTTLATYVLPPLLAQFSTKFPETHFSLARDNTRQIEAKLLDFELDVAMVEGPPHSAKIRKTWWRDEELILICSPAHRFAAKGTVSFQELAQCKWLLREQGSGTREVVETALERWNLPLCDALEFSGAESLKQAVAANLGVSFVSREAAQDQLALGRVKTLTTPDFSLRRPFYLLHLPGRPLSPAAKAFEKFLLVNQER
ncbi:LysR family transcriptional regulator [bacterium]|nr:MAG: LysR family transcriptional regulator [bacterium]